MICSPNKILLFCVHLFLKHIFTRKLCLTFFRIRVGRSIEGFGLSPGITKEQRLGVEKLMINAFAKLKGDLAGTYYPLLGMEETVRQKLVDDHFLFVSGDKNLIAAGMERDWPEGRGIFHNEAKTFLTWVNEEDQLRIISMQKGSITI
jgi:protein-arginine kinase